MRRFPTFVQLAGSATLLQLVFWARHVPCHRPKQGTKRWVTDVTDSTWPVELWTCGMCNYMCILYTYASASHLSSFIRTCTCIKIFLYIYGLYPCSAYEYIEYIIARQGEPPAKDPPNSQAYIQTYIQAYIQIKADTYLQAILTKTKQTHTQQRPPNSTPQNKTAKKYYLI